MLLSRLSTKFYSKIKFRIMDKMFFESKSRYAFDETVERLNNIIAEAGWRVTHTHDLKRV
jgi:uncharacterized protein (DUF302 family)